MTMTDDMVVVTEPNPLGDFLAEVLADLATRTQARQAEKTAQESAAVEARPDPRPPRTACKGMHRYALTNAQQDCASSAIDMRKHNSLTVAVFATGASPSATLYIDGAPEAGGPWLPEPWLANGRQITADTLLTVEVGSRFARVRLQDVSGTFAQGQGFTIITTPYNSGVDA